MAPVIPFMAEKIWQTLIMQYSPSEESVHLSDFPKAKAVNRAILKEVQSVREIITIAMKLRNESQLKVKQPLSALYLDLALKSYCEKYTDIIKGELNIKELIYLEDFSVLSDEYLKLNLKNAGRVLKGDLGTVNNLIESLTEEETSGYITQIKKGQSVNIGDYVLEPDLLILVRKDKSYLRQSEGLIKLAINTEINLELKAEGIYRGILRQCQVLRKESGFDVTDKVKLQFLTDSEYLLSIIDQYKLSIECEALAEISSITQSVMDKAVEIDDSTVVIRISSNNN